MLFHGDWLKRELISHIFDNVTFLFNFGRRLILLMDCLIHRLELKFTVILDLFLLYLLGFFGRFPPDWINDIKIWLHMPESRIPQVTRLLMHRITKHFRPLDPKFAVDCYIFFALCEHGQQLAFYFLWVFRDRSCRFNRFSIYCLWFGLDEPERWFFRLLVRAFLFGNVHNLGRRCRVDCSRLLAAVLGFIQSCSWAHRLLSMHLIDIHLDVAIFALKQGKNGLVGWIWFVLNLLVPHLFCKHCIQNILWHESFHYLLAISLGSLDRI